VTQDRVLLELARIAFSDVGAVYDEYGHLLDVNNLPLGTAAAIASWDVFKKNPTAGRGTVEHIRIRFWDKVRALELLAKHLGLLDDRLDVSGSLELEMKFKALDEGRARNAARTDVLALPPGTTGSEGDNAARTDVLALPPGTTGSGGDTEVPAKASPRPRSDKTASALPNMSPELPGGPTGV